VWIFGNILDGVVSVPGSPGEKTDPDDHVDGSTAIGVGQADRVVPAVGVVVAAVLGGVASQEATEGRVIVSVAEELEAVRVGLVAPGAAVGEGAMLAAPAYDGKAMGVGRCWPRRRRLRHGSSVEEARPSPNFR
jgi:hypothetical protein